MRSVKAGPICLDGELVLVATRDLNVGDVMREDDFRRPNGEILKSGDPMTPAECAILVGGKEFTQ